MSAERERALKSIATIADQLMQRKITEGTALVSVAMDYKDALGVSTFPEVRNFIRTSLTDRYSIEAIRAVNTTAMVMAMHVRSN